MWGEYRKICHKIACHFFMMIKIFNPSLVCHLILVTVFGKELQHQLTCRMDATHMEVLQRRSWSVHASLCTWQHSHVKIYHKSSLLFLPDPGLEYVSLHLTLRVFLNLTQYRNIPMSFGKISSLTSTVWNPTAVSWKLQC